MQIRINAQNSYMKFTNVSFKRKKSTAAPQLPAVRGFELRGDMKLEDYLQKSAFLGYQASQLGRACELAEKIKRDKCTVFLSFTSNIVSSGLREIIAQLCREKAVQCIITSTGAIEEDYMKSKQPFLLGEFDVDDEAVKKAGLNRIGNVLVPDDYYVEFEKFNMKFLADLARKNENVISPSHYAAELGKKISDKNSFLHWASSNDIPVYCPGFVDGAIGDHVFFYNQGRKSADRIIIDQARDLDNFYKVMLTAQKTAGIIVGGGIAKHHLIGAAILRNGLDYAVYLSTGTEGDGSLSDARPREAVSWNKLKEKKNSVFVEAEATLAFPLLALKLL